MSEATPYNAGRSLTGECPPAPDAGLGWMPALAAIGSAGVLLVGLAASRARALAPGAELLFWTGLALILLPAGARLASASAARNERIGLLVTLGLGLGLPKLLQSPLQVIYYDELLHWRTANDILRFGRLYHENPLLPVSPYYPGLENTTAALAQQGGLAIADAGALLLLAAQVVLVLSLFLFYEQLGCSPRIAGLGTLLYMANPAFLFFQKQYAYESLALPLALLVIWATARLASAPRDRRKLLWGVVALVLLALIVTHHITAYMLIGFLALWSLVALWMSRRQRSHDGPSVSLSPVWVTLLALLGTLAWLLLVARITIPYLGGNLVSTLRELMALIAGEVGGRKLFHGFAGDVAPLWERLSGYGAVGLITLTLPFGLWRVWREHRSEALPITLALGALAYPATQALRVTSFGLQISGRTPEFVFVPLAYVLALGLTHHWLRRKLDILRTGLLVLGLAVVFAGGAILGWPRWERLPGEYLVVADARSIESQGLEAAAWAEEVLGPDQRIAADRINGLLMTAYGEQHQVTTSFSGVDVPGLFMSTSMSAADLAILSDGGIQYVVVDRRLLTSLPAAGVYFEPGESRPGGDEALISAEALDKFDTLEGASRIYDSGDIIVYDVRALSGTH